MNHSPFSSADRSLLLSRLGAEEYDLLVIGGGITGAGIALDAASRGLKVALIEKNDFASGTSSRSTKLIHGGLRYLKQFEFALVKEVGSERAIVHGIAPHLVLAEKMLLPLSEGRGFGSLLTSFGLMLYDWLAGVQPADRRRMLTRKKTLRMEPLLLPEGIKGGGLYAEYRTDDARLTIEIAKTAAKHGAVLVNYVQATSFVYTDGKICGAEVCDVLNDTTFSIRATTVINAAGPWVDELRELDGSKKGKTLHLTKGVHLVVPRKRLPVQQAIYFNVADGRMIFAVPRGKTTYIGTTDTDYQQGIDEVRVVKEDAQYLLDAVNENFPTIKLTLSDIESSWAGLRPLIHEEGKSASELSRKDEIFESPSGLLSIAGGKLTGYRKMAERVVDLAIKKHFRERRLKACYTQAIALCGGDFKNSKKVRQYVVEVHKVLGSTPEHEYTAHYLVHTYGRQSEGILAEYKKNLIHASSPDEALVLAECSFALKHEMVQSALDFFNRRTGMLFFDAQRLRRVKDRVMKELKEKLQWSDSRWQEEKQKLEEAIIQTTNF